MATKNVQNNLTKVFILESKYINEQLATLLMSLFTETLLKREESEIFNVKLPRKTSMFIKTKDEIYEMMQFNEKNRCFFIENTVSSNGKIYTATKVDPIFIFIQFLEEHCKSKAQPLDQLLEGDSIIFLDFLNIVIQF